MVTLKLTEYVSKASRVWIGPLDKIMFWQILWYKMLEILRSAPSALHIVGREYCMRMNLVFPVSALKTEGGWRSYIWETSYLYRNHTRLNSSLLIIFHPIWSLSRFDFLSNSQILSGRQCWGRYGGVEERVNIWSVRRGLTPCTVSSPLSNKRHDTGPQQSTANHEKQLRPPLCPTGIKQKVSS